MARTQVALRDSHRPLGDGARITGRVAPGHRVAVTLHLRRGAAPEAAHHASARDVARVRRFATQHGLTVGEVHLDRRSVALHGPASAMNRAFRVELIHLRRDGERHRSHEGAIHLPLELAPAIDAVLGLDNRRIARPHLRHFAPQARRATRLPDVAHYYPTELARLYEFNARLDGRGECIGLVELGGGFHQRDLQTYFRRVTLDVPAIAVVPVNGARNRPGGHARGVDAEVLLDIEVAGAAAPGARLAVYFAPCDERGFVDAVKAAIHDTVNTPSVLSISWASVEADWSGQARRAMDDALRDAARRRITVCASSGDAGAACGLRSGVAVEFPASSPYALACGGTRLLARDGRITDEVVWNDLAAALGATGGGVSEHFPRPAYQRRACRLVSPRGFAGRGVPDVAANADPETGYVVRVDGRWLRLGGTSAAAPLWAGLVARLNQGLGRRVGFLNPRLYRLAPRPLRAVTHGDNGVYPAGAGWNACTGLGTPRGRRLLDALRATRSSG